MKKLIICIIVVAIVVLGFFTFNTKSPEESRITPEELDSQGQVQEDANISNIINNSEKNNNVAAVNINSAEELTAFVDELYLGNQDLYPSLMSQSIDVTDSETVTYMTGLKNGNDLEYLVVSEPMMSSQAYSLVIAKVKDGASADAVAKEMSENINMRKWVCVSAEVLYATSSDNLAFLVMASEEMATPVYDSFKSKVGSLGEEYKKEDVIDELPEDMY